jgi:hypothetical protein
LAAGADALFLSANYPNPRWHSRLWPRPVGPPLRTGPLACDADSWMAGASPEVEYRHVSLVVDVLGHFKSRHCPTIMRLLIERSYVTCDSCWCEHLARAALQRRAVGPLNESDTRALCERRFR